MADSACKAVVSGRVQGVGYRYFVYQHAKFLDLKGYVKNMMDGDVEVYAEGDKSAIDSLLRKLERGPGFAHVHKIDVQWPEPSGKYTDFNVTY